MDEATIFGLFERQDDERAGTFAWNGVVEYHFPVTLYRFSSICVPFDFVPNVTY